MLTRRTAAVAVATVVVATVAVQLSPVAASADGVVGSLGLPDVAAQAGTCRLATSVLRASALTATVDRLPTGEVDFTWHLRVHAGVSSVDTCVTGVLVTSRLTDSTAVPNCPPVVQSDAVTASSDDPLWYQSGATDYEVDNGLDFPVAYFGGAGTAQSAGDAVVSRVQNSDDAGPDAGSTSVRCDRLRSTVTEYDTAYYQNSQRQFVPFCSQQMSYEFVATPAGPQQVGDPIVESITC